MADYDFSYDNNLIDHYLNVEAEANPLPFHSHMSSDKFIQSSQTKTQAPKPMAIMNRTSIKIEQKPEQKQQQSNLHNCPKHLIKLIIQCVGLGKHTAEELSREFINCDIEVYECIRGLLGILETIRRNKLKSYSKELLKIVFENHSQNIPRLKLLENPLISKVFEGKRPQKMCEAKDILKRFAIQKLIQKKDNFNDRSKNQKKNINTKYLELFLEQLKLGRIKERISKEDKMRILE